MDKNKTEREFDSGMKFEVKANIPLHKPVKTIKHNIKGLITKVKKLFNNL